MNTSTSSSSLGAVSYSGHNANSSQIPGQYPSNSGYETEKVSELTAQNAHHRRQPQSFHPHGGLTDPQRPRVETIGAPFSTHNQYLPHGSSQLPTTQSAPQQPHRYHSDDNHSSQLAGPSTTIDARPRKPPSFEGAGLYTGPQSGPHNQHFSRVPPTQLAQQQQPRRASSDNCSSQPTRAPSPPPLNYRYDGDQPTYANLPPVSTMSQNLPPPQNGRPVYSSGPPINNYPPQPSQSSTSRELINHRRTSGSSAPAPHNPMSSTTSTALPPAPSLPPSQLPQQPSQSQSQPSDPSLASLEPLVLASADAALAPMRAGIESLWSATVGNVRHAMFKMHQDFTKIVTQERQKNATIKATMGQLQSELQAEVTSLGQDRVDLKARLDVGDVVRDKLKHEVERWKRDNAALKGDNDKVKRENEMLKIALDKASRVMAGYQADFAKLRTEKERLEIERGVMANFAKSGDTSLQTGEKGEREVVDSMTGVLSVVSEQVARQMDGKMNTILAEIQEQRTLRIQAEQRSAEALRQLEEAKAFAEPSQFYRGRPPNDRQGSSSRTSSPQLRRASQPGMDPSVNYSRPSSANNETHRSRQNSMSSPQMLSDAPPLTRLSVSSRSSTSTHVDASSSPSLLKGSLQDEVRRESPVIQRQRFQSSPLNAPVDPRQSHFSPPHTENPPTPPHSQPTSPVRKRTRSEYEQGQEDTTVGRVQPPSAPHPRVSSPPRFRVKMEDCGECPTTAVAVQVDCPDPEPVPAIRQSTSTEEGEINHNELKKAQAMAKDEKKLDYEEGEVVDPVRRQSTSWYYTHPGGNQPPRRHFKLGINHIDLLYKTESNWLVCRMCLTRRQEACTADRRSRGAANVNVERFQKTASWDELVRHCQSEHPKACQDLEKLNPSQIAEKKQRMLSSSTMFMR